MAHASVALESLRRPRGNRCGRPVSSDVRRHSKENANGFTDIAMIGSRKTQLWVGAILSLPMSVYAGLSMFFYVWRNAAEPDLWPPERAAPLAYGSLALCVAALVLFIYCVVRIVRSSDSQPSTDV